MEDIKNTEVATDIATPEPAGKVYTEDEVNRLADQRVSQARSRWDKETTKKVSQAEKLAAMSQEDQYKFKLEQKEAELEAKEREFTLRDNKIAAMKVLSDKEIPADLVDFVVHEDADTMKANIDKLDKFIKQAVAAQVTKRLASPTPKAGLSTSTEVNKDMFNNMSATQRQELFTSNRDLYNKLKG